MRGAELEVLHSRSSGCLQTFRVLGFGFCWVYDLGLGFRVLRLLGCRV